MRRRRGGRRALIAGGALALAVGLGGCDEVGRATAGLWPRSLDCGRSGGAAYAAFVAADERLSLTPADIGASSAAPDDLQGGWMVEFVLCPDAAQRFADLTERNIGGKIALVVDGETLIEPVVRQRIADGRVTLNGGYAQAEAERIARAIGGGAAAP